MRMWNISPNLLCRKHLLGEHVECHMFIGTLKQGKKLEGYIHGGLVEVHNIIKRHDTLATEMERRGFRHNSPILSECENLLWNAGSLDIEKNKEELKRRCVECRALITNNS